MNWRGRIYLFVLLTGLCLNACKDVNDPQSRVNNYLVTNQSKGLVTTEEIRFKLMWAQREYPEVGPLAAMISTDINVQKLIYKTTFQNKDIQASGLVYLPQTAGNYPVVCFLNGANTLHSLAPTVNMESDILYMLESVASMGFIVVVPDYIGFGESAQLPHPFLHARSAIQSTLDMLSAMNEFALTQNTQVKPTKDLFLFGYSEGAWATLILQNEIESKHSGEFNLVASASAAGPYSLEYMNQYITSQNEYESPYFLTYLFNAYSALGIIPNPISDFIREPYASTIPELFNGQHSGGSINAALTCQMGDLLTSDYRTPVSEDPKFAPFNSALADNSVKVNNWLISTPTLLIHGGEDKVIPVSMSEKTVSALKAAGNLDSKIRLMIIPGVGHTDGLIPVGVSTINFFLEMKK